MNILIISDDGKDSVGLAILREAAKKTYGGEPVALVTNRPLPGSSLSITLPTKIKTGQPSVNMRGVEGYLYEIEGTAADALYLAMFWPEMVTGYGKGFDLLLTGVNQGHNCGVDSIHSGTVSVAALATSVFGLPSIAFSQQIEAENRTEEQGPEKNNRIFFRTAEEQTAKFLVDLGVVPQCLSINYPSGQPKGFKRVPLAMRSRWFPDMSPTRNTGTDMDWLEEGYITITDIHLSMAEPMKL